MNFKKLLVILSGVSYAQAYCNHKIILPGDGCWAMANRCQQSMEVIKKLNGNLCDAPIIGKRYCCNDGGLEPLTKIDSNGECQTHRVQSGDNCHNLEQKYELNSIEDINKGKAGWFGCNNLQAGEKICVSEGRMPLPDPDYEQECGLKSIDKDGKRNLTCPLNVCCSRWGFCGTTEEFCNIPADKPGCQSNCDMDYKPSQIEKVPEQLRIGYFESWNTERDCVKMRVSEIPGDLYTHIHFAFAQISPTFEVQVDNISILEQFSSHEAKFKKIVSFGGWAFNDPGPTQTLFTRMASDHRGDFIRAVVEFVAKYKLDGVDFDWEYPGAEERGGRKEDKSNYVSFVSELRSALPSDKSISIAAPASYWYLRQFDIAEMAKHLDYIVYMTYDFYGQWDYSISWTGPYLRSHVDWQVTMNALTLITKAGVPSYKVLLGIGLYGRAFKQVDPDCKTPDCRFSSETADVGMCTQTGGYLSMAEIEGIHSTRSKEFNETSRVTVITYGLDQWVSFTEEAENERRRQDAKTLVLGGTVEWAIDLLASIDDPNDYEDEDIDDYDAGYSCPSVEIGDLSEVEKYPPECRDDLILDRMMVDLDRDCADLKRILDHRDYDKKFDRYAIEMRPALEQKLMRWTTEFFPLCFDCEGGGNPNPDGSQLQINYHLKPNCRLDTNRLEACYQSIEDKIGLKKEEVFLEDNKVPFRLRAEYKVPNPKQIAEKMVNLCDVSTDVRIHQTEANLTSSHLIDSMILSVSYMSEVTLGMKDVIDVADQMAQNDKNELILGLTIGFAVLGLLGAMVSGPIGIAISGIALAGEFGLAIDSAMTANTGGEIAVAVLGFALIGLSAAQLTSKTVRLSAVATITAKNSANMTKLLSKLNPRVLEKMSKYNKFRIKVCPI